MSKKISKEELRSDMFLTVSDRALDYVVEQKNVIAVVLTVVLCAGLAFAGYEAFQNWTENKAAKALYPLNREFADKSRDIERRRLETQKAPTDKKAAPVGPFKVDFQTEFGGLAGNMKKEIQTHAGTSAASIAAVDLAKAMIDHNQPEMAIDLLKPLASGPKTVMQALIKSQLGAAYSHTGKYQEAIAEYDSIIKNKEFSYMHPEAFIKEAICYDKMGQGDKARELLQKVSLDFPESQAAQTAKLYARVVGGSAAK